MPPATPRRDHVPVLDGLRAVAVLLVLWSHLPREALPSPFRLAAYALQPGYFGVDLFFVLSGFLITRILLVDRARGSPVFAFIIKRALRIFPIYYLAILFFLVAEPGRYLLWCAAYLSNVYFAFNPDPSPLRHTWSLAVEEHFYLVWPFMVYLLPLAWGRRAAMYGFPLIAIACAVALILSGVADPGRFIFSISIFRAMSLSLGASIAFNESWLRHSRARLFALAAAFILAAVPIVGVGRSLGEWLGLAKMVGFALLSTGCLLAALGFQGSRTLPERGLDNPVMRYIGRISYGLYLYHYPVYRALGVLPEDHGSTPAPLWMGAVAIAATFALASLSYALIESPILRFKDRLKFAGRRSALLRGPDTSADAPALNAP